MTPVTPGGAAASVLTPRPGPSETPRGEVRTLYPWLMPLMNCWGGGFHRKRMVVEFTASACTFWGGAVGTVPGIAIRDTRQQEAREGERWKHS